MEQEHPASGEATLDQETHDAGFRDEASQLHLAPKPASMYAAFFTSHGLRTAWSVALFAALYFTLREVTYIVFGIIYSMIFPPEWLEGTSALTVALGESVELFAVIAAAALVALTERQPGNLLAFNLTGPRRLFHFAAGFVLGFAALSALIAGLSLGGWLRFGPVALSTAGAIKYGLIWAIAFLTVALVEEGIFRCYLQFTLARGINFWWALGAIALILAYLASKGRVNGIGGVILIAAIGLIPCLLVELFKARYSSFWQAAWVTSTLFGAIHTGNRGETWIGIFAAASIGFAFCVSVLLTGSAWWAIGFHAAWDWAETFFYGTADSGLPAKGHYLTTTPFGSVLWSGGTDGPEGSLLVIPAVLLILLLLFVLYGRRSRSAPASPAASPLLEETAG